MTSSTANEGTIDRTEGDSEMSDEENVSARFVSRRAKRRRRTMPDTQRWKRRPLQADEDRWQQYLESNVNSEGIQVLLDLDNASDSLEPIEVRKDIQKIHSIPYGGEGGRERERGHLRSSEVDSL